MTAAFALIATAILLALAVFQAQLAAGQPLGRFAWGGAHEVLPRRLRIASAISTAVYVAIALVLLDAADAVDALPVRLDRRCCLGAGRLFPARGRDERRLAEPR